MSRRRNWSSTATQSSSIGVFRSRSYSALRGWNHARSLLAARSARNWIASGRKPVKVGDATAMTELRVLGVDPDCTPERLSAGCADDDGGVQAAEAERGRQDPV